MSLGRRPKNETKRQGFGRDRCFTMKLIEEYEDDHLGHDIEVFKCRCGREFHVWAGGDIAGCPNCESV